MSNAKARWWRTAREQLLGRPDRRLRLEELHLTSAELDLRCTLPWTRLELSTRRLLGPCCPDFQTAPAAAAGLDLGGQWNGERFRTFRRSLGATASSTCCRATCPSGQGRTHELRRFVLRGGRPSFVDNQLGAVEDMLCRREVARSQPLELSFPPTTACNYDCLMCEWGAEGSRADELGPELYQGLAPLLPTLRTIEVTGGEPLGSRAFRDFLAGLDFDQLPDLEIAIVTNGSGLVPEEIARFRRLPFVALTVSLNAATAETYAAVNRGLPFARVRANLDALVRQRRAGAFRGRLVYSMVLLKRNHHELLPFAALARADGAEVRFMLPMFDRNHESIMTDAAVMARCLGDLEQVAAGLRERGEEHQSRLAAAEAAVLRERLARGVLEPLPDGRRQPTDPVDEARGTP
jgi:molybdenum cofactor biosynthesis enzyme MoaA